MSFAMLSRKRETAAAKTKSALRTGNGGDAFEREAGRNTTLAQGEFARPQWSLSGMTIESPGTIIQTKLAINKPGDEYEQQADKISEQVMRMREPRVQRKCVCGGTCSKCQAGEKQDQIQTKRARGFNQNQNQQQTAPRIVSDVLESPGRPLDSATRAFMEPRFGVDFSSVRVHSDTAAGRSASQIGALAYTAGRNVVFREGQYQPNTSDGRRLLAHELAHVLQQSTLDLSPKLRPLTGAEGGRAAKQVMRASDPNTAAASAPPSDVPLQSDLERLVREEKWCRDSEKSGALHPGEQCYREIPASEGYPKAQQYCFDEKTGAYVEESPDYCAAVSGQNSDGTCDIPLSLLDPPNPFTHRGRRALCHAISDIAPAAGDPDLIGRNFFRVAGLEMGIALPKNGLAQPGLSTLLIPAILSYVAGKIGEEGLPVLSRFAAKQGFVPTIGLGAGIRGAQLSVGFEKRDRALPLVPINSYLTLSLDTSLSTQGSTFLAKVGVRVDPGRQGGLFAFGSVGAGIAVGNQVGGAASTEVGIGYRAAGFIDVEVVREEVNGDSAYLLTLKLVAPRRVLFEWDHAKD